MTGFELGGEIKSKDVMFGTISAGTDDERVVFVAPFNCVVTDIFLSNSATTTADADNYTTINIENKGTTGTATDDVVSFDTHSTGDAGVFTAFLPVSVKTLSGGALTATSVTKNTALTLTKTDTGTGLATDNLIVTVKFKAQAGLVKY